MYPRFLMGLIGLCCVFSAKAQQPAIKAHSEVPIAVVGACIHQPNGQELSGATLIFQGEQLIRISNAPLPEGVRIIRAPGLHLYPSFIDLNSNLGLPEAAKAHKDGPQPETKRDPNLYYTNDAIRPDQRAADQIKVQESEGQETRKLGIGYQMVHAHDGILGGLGALVSSGAPKEASVVMDSEAFLPWSFDKGSSTQDYPSSLPGANALIRQFLVDEAWYAQHPEKNKHALVFQAYRKAKNRSSLVQARSKWDLVLWNKLLGKDHKIIYLDAGDAYQRPDLFLSDAYRLALPASLPYPLNLQEPLLANRGDFSYMKHWEMAPTAAAMFERLGKEIALYPGKRRSELFAHLRKLHAAGASKTYLLKALTLVPAQWLGLDRQMGSLEPGKQASFFLSTGDIFTDPKAEVVLHVVRGTLFYEKEMLPHIVGGQYTIIAPDVDLAHQKRFDIKGNPYAPAGEFFPNPAQGVSVSLNWQSGLLSGTMESLALQGYVQWSLQQKNDSLWSGIIRLPGNKIHTIKLERKGFAKPYDRPEPDTLPDDRMLYLPELLTGPIYYPFHPFGFAQDSLPPAQDLVLRNATVWTNTEAGIQTNCDVWISNGKIKAVGQDLNAPGVKEMDLQGQHLTTGIIDEHSHIALRHGVNESGNAISAEVRMRDGLNPEDPNIYRQLAAGVTAAQLLHGSANPIGGQSAIVKMRWGSTAEEMLIQDAPAFIKFALGENVKQSNWGEKFVIRYPQTRMGVETYMREQFIQALKNDPEKPFSFQEEALREIAAGKRFITCHSYVASEILMLMRLAESFGFRIRTFTHVLEGYKVAKEMAEHGAAGSTFSDWWAYKEEVRDAIPYNAGLMLEAGVLTALNSDDAAMGTRLNLEAAKMVRYSKLSEEDAWKMVTLNPAKMLGLDHRLGKIEPGMDADLVWWDAHPMSVTARPHTTWVDGRPLFNQKRHEALLERSQTNRSLLERKMLKAAEKGEKTRPVRPKLVIPYHCEDLH